VILDGVPSTQLDLAMTSIDAYNRGDRAALLALVADDVVFEVPIGMANAGTYRGREGFTKMAAGWEEAWDEFRIEAEDPIEYGGAVIVPVTQHGRGRGSGVEIQMQAAYLMRFSDGLLQHLRICQSKDEALREAGSR
jgi:ketosteroid isomerase-like protein